MSAARARRFSSPALVSSSEAAAEGGARAVWLVWSECVGSDPEEGAGGGWSGDGGSADCSSWLSQWLTSRSLLPLPACALRLSALSSPVIFSVRLGRLLRTLPLPTQDHSREAHVKGACVNGCRWSEPWKLCRGSIAGQPTLGARRESLYVPVVDWKKVFWSGGMVQNGTGVEVCACACACVAICACA